MNEKKEGRIMKKLKFDVSSWEKVQKKPGEFGRIFLGISVGLLKRSSKERPDSLELNRIRNAHYVSDCKLHGGIDLYLQCSLGSDSFLRQPALGI